MDIFFFSLYERRIHMKKIIQSSKNKLDFKFIRAESTIRCLTYCNRYNIIYVDKSLTD